MVENQADRDSNAGEVLDSNYNSESEPNEEQSLKSESDGQDDDDSRDETSTERNFKQIFKRMNPAKKDNHKMYVLQLFEFSFF
jgi:hypothetical protein